MLLETRRFGGHISDKLTTAAYKAVCNALYVDDFQCLPGTLARTTHLCIDIIQHRTVNFADRTGICSKEGQLRDGHASWKRHHYGRDSRPETHDQIVLDVYYLGLHCDCY